MTATTDLARPRFARAYMRAASNAERRGATEHRRLLLQGLHGTVLELGAGHGLNFPHYPTSVSEVIAVEPEPTLRAHSAEAAASAPVPVRVLAGVADDLRLRSKRDAAVASLVLCSVPDQHRALAELHRVLRPGGELRFYEHVIPRCQPKRLLLQAADHSGLWPKSPAAATQPATPALRSSTPASRSNQATGSCSPPQLSSRRSHTSSASHDDPDHAHVLTPERRRCGQRRTGRLTRRQLQPRPRRSASRSTKRPTTPAAPESPPQSDDRASRRLPPSERSPLDVASRYARSDPLASRATHLVLAINDAGPRSSMGTHLLVAKRKADRARAPLFAERWACETSRGTRADAEPTTGAR